MKVDNLVKMANQIGTFFESLPDREQARLDIINHLQKFWDPGMRQRLLDHVAASGDGDHGLREIVHDAIAAHKQHLV
jgi:formate dehydrogenase subunit delta